MHHFSQGLLEGFDRVLAGEDVHKVVYDIIISCCPAESLNRKDACVVVYRTAGKCGIVVLKDADS